MTRKEARSKREVVASDWPVDLKPDAFLPSAQPPWLPEGALAGQAVAPICEPFAVGEAVRLVREPQPFAALPKKTRRKYGAVVGELFEVVALTLPGELVIARRVEAGLQTLFVPADCVEGVDFTTSRQPASAPPSIAVESESEEDDHCDTLAGSEHDERGIEGFVMPIDFKHAE